MLNLLNTIYQGVKMSNEMKKKVLEIAEDHAVLAIDHVYELAKVYVQSTENIYDDTALAFLESLKGALVDKADEIDGEENR